MRGFLYALQATAASRRNRLAGHCSSFWKTNAMARTFDA
jgi:hypothetical protein